jgi:hypothetical protein
MKEILVDHDEPVYITSINGYRTIKVKKYEADDGTIFDAWHDANTYEIRKRLKSIDHKEFDGFTEFYSETWYKAKTPEELDFLKQVLGDPTWSYLEDDEKIQVGEWFCVHRVDGGDNRDTCTFIPAKVVRQQALEFLKLFGEDENG